MRVSKRALFIAGAPGSTIIETIENRSVKAGEIFSGLYCFEAEGRGSSLLESIEARGRSGIDSGVWTRNGCAKCASLFPE